MYGGLGFCCGGELTLKVKKRRKRKRIEVRETKKIGVLYGGRNKQKEVEVKKMRRMKRGRRAEGGVVKEKKREQ